MDVSEEVVACMLVHVLLPLAGIYVAIWNVNHRSNYLRCA